MTGLRVEIAKHVVINILNTLNTDDYVNIYNFSQSAEPPLVPCFNNTLVQVTWTEGLPWTVCVCGGGDCVVWRQRCEDVMRSEWDDQYHQFSK